MPTNINKLRDDAMQYARKRKEETVAESHDTDRPDIPPMLTGWRGESPVATFMPVGGARDVILHAARILIAGMGCDVVSIATEAWTATDPETNPITGKRWESGQMEDVAYNHDGLAKGWITEMLNIMTVNRAGDLSSGLIKFTVTMKRSSLGIISWDLEWGDEVRMDSTGEGEDAIAGVIPETLIELMNEVDVMTEFFSKGLPPEMVGDLTYEEQRAHADCTLIKMLPRFQYEGAAMLMSDNPERQAVLEESLRGNPYLFDIWSIQNPDDGWEGLN